MDKRGEDWLPIAQAYFQESVAPLADELDREPAALQTALTGLANLGLMGLRIPERWGGRGANELAFFNFQELAAKASGALAFLQTQHQSAAAMLVKSENTDLKKAYLPRITQGEVFLGIGFSHLRRTGDPLVKAIPVTGGYELVGQVPWVTGWGFFQEFIVAAVLPDRQVIFGLVPLTAKMDAIAFTSPMVLAAMTSTNTVTATLKSWFLPSEKVVFIQSADWIQENDRQNLLRPTAFPLGCAGAGLDLIKSTAVNKPLPFIFAALAALEQELNQCRTAILEAQQHPQTSLTLKLELRAWAIELAARCAHTAIAVASGAANYSHHPAQRVYREALAFTVTGQNTVVMEATLARLIRSGVGQEPTN